MIRNREAKTTGSICIALLRRITFKVEVANGVRLLCNMEIIKSSAQGGNFPSSAHADLAIAEPNESTDLRIAVDFVGVSAQR
jgi:hypothetical protein